MNPGQTPSIDELRKRLAEVEAIVAALRQGKADTLIGEAGPFLIRLKSVVEERERARREAERLAREWENTFDAVPEGVWILDTENRVVRANCATERIFGCQRESIIGRHCWEIVHGTREPISDCPMLRMRQSLRREQQEFSQGDRWYGVTVDPILDETGQLHGAVHTISDITESKRAMEALRELHERDRNIYELISDYAYTFRVEPDGTLCGEWLNDTFVRVFGFTMEEIEARGGWQSMVHTEDLPAMIQHALRVVGGQRDIHETRFVTKAGETRWIRDHAVPVKDAATGRVVRIYGAAQDITDRKRAEEDLRHQRILLERITTASPVGIAVVDRNGRITFANPQAEKILGLEREQITKRTYNDPAWRITDIAGGPFPDEELPFRRVMATGQMVRDIQHAIEWPDGRRVLLSINGAPLFDSTGAVDGGVFTFSDITAQKQAEEALREREEQLRQSQKLEAVGRLAGGVAHDFNNILTAIMMQVDLTTSVKDLPTEAREGLEQIRAAAERAANLTRQLLIFSRRQVMQPRDVDLNEIVTSLAKMLQRIIGEDVRLQLNLHPRVLLTRADPGMLDQVLMNLVVNARDAMPKGGKLIIETTERSLTETEAAATPDALAGRYVSLRVTDTGCGIPPDHLPHIFEPFFTTKEPGKGTGLGLATVFGIVKQHRGWITVESQVGKGSTFQVFLTALEAPEAAAHPVAPPAKTGGTETILLVEDDDAVRRIMHAILAAHGYKVLEAANGVEALKIWAQNGGRVDLLLTDLVMPEGISGRELADRLRALRPDLPVVLASGYSADILGHEFSLQPGQSFIQKPVSPTQLLETIRRCLDETPNRNPKTQDGTTATE